MIVFLDTNIVIYAIEGDPTFGTRARLRLASIQAAGDTILISDLTRMECLVGPLISGNAALEGQFRSFFTQLGAQVVPISAAVCDRAALIRATYRFKPMDALQLAAAVEHGAHGFLTNDVRLNRFTGITVEVLP